MKISKKLLTELQNRLKVGNRRGVHLNAIPGRSRYKFDITRLAHIDKDLPTKFVHALLTDLPLKFKITWKNNVPDLNALFEEEQSQLVKITKSLENLINQTDVIESEKGVNTFGFGFPILVRRDQSDNKLTLAPILIWSLSIKRTKEFNTWQVQRNEDDPIYINEVLINHLNSDAQIEIDPISNEHLEDGLIDKEELLDICVDIINAINTSVPDDIRAIFQEQLNHIQAINNKKHYEALALTANNSLIEFGGLFSIFEVQKQNIINDYEYLRELGETTINLEDMEEHFFQSISSVETDPSQQEILRSLNKSRNVLIQGPPGTGKSQLLTAILVNALENHQKTIVVCEKRTALEVLRNSLIDRGLNYCCILIKDSIKDRRKVVNSVRDRVDNSSYRRQKYTYSKTTLKNIVAKAQFLIDAINKGHEQLSTKLLEDKNWTKIVGELLAELRGNQVDYQLALDTNHFEYNGEELNETLEILRKGESLYERYKGHQELSFLNPEKLSGDNPFVLERQIKHDFKEYQNLLQTIASEIKHYEKEYFKIRTAQLTAQENKLITIIDPLLAIFTKYDGQNDFYDEQKTRGIFFQVTTFFSSSKKAILEDQIEVNRLFDELEKEVKQARDIKELGQANSLKEKQERTNEYLNSIHLTKLQFTSLVDAEIRQWNLNQALEAEFETTTSKHIQSNLAKLSTKFKEDDWTMYALSQDSHISVMKTITDVLKMQETYFKNDNDLFLVEFNWFNYFNALSPKQKQLIYAIADKQDWENIFMPYYLNSLLIKYADTALPTDDSKHQTLGKTLTKLEKEQIKYIQAYWLAKQMDLTKKFAKSNTNLAVENLYNKRAGKKHKRLSLREIVKFDTDLFTTFFPIILATPDVTSNLFKGKHQYFDLVMFDEASQLKLEDNFPALLKGKQIVIAGDEHQMPPSNYFSKIFNGLINDEDDFEEETERIRNDLNKSLLDCESLLEFATELGFDKMHLDFHYRSRHPHLIDFSNFAFYKQRLKPLPSNLDYIPIKYIQVNGTYAANANDAEAEMVLSIIEHNISRLPNGNYPSIGVATFNINQRNLIIRKINQRKKFEHYKTFNNKVLELEANGFFVKNLENIQGDERDVIILSVTYGKNEEGKFAQRFGSINHQKGYKLLNVIITRAKYKVYVCSSIPEEVFLGYKEALTLEGSNNRRAVFYAYLAYTKAVSEQDEEARQAVLNALAANTSKKSTLNIFDENFDSPFEEEVYHALTEYFDKDQLIPQFQFAGFRIDIVYDAQKIGVPKIAIECDGATYHSSKEAYLHDQHRQKILEGYGFVFHRIWSTNWWRNPKKEIQKLVNFIKEQENKPANQIQEEAKIGDAFTDHIKELGEAIATSPSNAEGNQVTEAGEKTIQLNTKLKVKYLNMNEELKLKLVSEATPKQARKGSVQEVAINSLLGEALKGKRVGDTVRIGKLDNFVQVLEILD